ncbi:Protein of unknown function [Pyronema omphalodes CBS 100304]|uniref:Uncharacterized protein n=1 Tax=Pyronema omphalodes (strain CBS 100304) TaxID=1076935 RepID=U4LVT0_PYROM|nr:Protein of unknown function [Pyronema omphalodes CBS 100304]
MEASIDIAISRVLGVSQSRTRGPVNLGTFIMPNIRPLGVAAWADSLSTHRSVIMGELIVGLSGHEAQSEVEQEMNGR